jgi:cytochrome b pre-mRNA-processing protein 3
MFSWLFSSSGTRQKAYELYGTAVDQARQPVFYTQFGVQDTIDGRFDMIVLHLFLLERRLAAAESDTAKLRRMLQEAMIGDMDRSLRELGVGDMSIGKEVKKMGVAWFGRLKAYAAALGEDDPQQAMTAALVRNLYKVDDAEAATHAPGMARYTLASAAKLAGYSDQEVLDLRFDFADPTPTGDR